eukprot:8671987-Prorocentrum_lima.AAC.1
MRKRIPAQLKKEEGKRATETTRPAINVPTGRSVSCVGAGGVPPGRPSKLASRLLMRLSFGMSRVEVAS